MVVMAYLAGLISTPAAFLGAWAGYGWYRRYRRAQSGSEPLHLNLVPVTPPPPSSPQAGPVLNRMSMRSVPGTRRNVHGSRRR